MRTPKRATTQRRQVQRDSSRTKTMRSNTPTSDALSHGTAGGQIYRQSSQRPCRVQTDQSSSQVSTFLHYSDRSLTPLHGLSVCGPTSLQASARAATKRVNRMSDLLGGQAAITFQAETFGW